MRVGILSIALVFLGTSDLFAESTSLAGDTLALHQILDSCYPGSSLNIWLFIKKAPWLTNEANDTSGGRIRSLCFLSLPTLPPTIGFFDSLQVLYLGGKYIYGSGTEYEANPLPLELFSLSHLKMLTLFARNLDTLPMAIGNLVNLTQLIVRYNSITYLPDEFGNLQSLQICDLSENNLRSIPQAIGNLKKLTELVLSYNKLDSLPHEVGNLSSLVYGVFDNNNLYKIPEEIGYLSNLNRLYLGNNNLTTLPGSIVHLKAGISVDSNDLCTLPCRIQSFLDTFQFDPAIAPWRMMQRCAVIPVPSCTSSAVIQKSPTKYSSYIVTNTASEIYDPGGRYLGTTQNNQLPPNLRTGIYFLRSTGVSGRITKQCVVK